MTTPEISIVLPTYNGSALLPRAIESCLAQTFQNFELIIVDDCSTDNTLEIAQAFAKKDSRIKVCPNATNQKLPASLNKGFAAATGKFLTWTSDDNLYLPRALERMYHELTTSDADLVYADYDVIDTSDAVVEHKKLKGPEHLFTYNHIGACFLYKRAVYDKLGGYRVDLFCAEDYEYWLRIWTDGFKLRHIPEVLYLYADNPVSLTATKRTVILEKTIQLKLEYAERAPASVHSKTKALFRLYRKAPSQELVEAMKSLAPVYATYLLLRHKLQRRMK